MSASIRAAIVGAALAIAGCGGARANVAVSGNEGAASASPAALSRPTFELVDRATAVVHGQRVTFDGVSEGLAWPSLLKALGRGEDDRAPLTILVRRDVPMESVLRTVWTLRAADVRLQTADALGVVREIELRTKPAQASPGCHLAVFVQPDQSLRIAAPGGPREIHGDAPNEQLARALDVEHRQCPLRYVAFGAQTSDAPWGSVFDVASSVDLAKSAGEARYVLGEPVHLVPVRPPQP
jgi:hypothetical protein